MAVSELEKKAERRINMPSEPNKMLMGMSFKKGKTSYSYRNAYVNGFLCFRKWFLNGRGLNLFIKVLLNSF